MRGSDWVSFTIDGRSFHVKARYVFAVGTQDAFLVTQSGEPGEAVQKTCISVKGLGTLPIDETVEQVAAILEAAGQ